MNFTADLKSYRARLPEIKDPEAFWDAMVDHEISNHASCQCQRFVENL